MKKNSFIINVSRGSIIDETELISSLRNRSIKGAALDVLEKEPPSKDNELLKMENVIITPHVAWYSEQSKKELVIGAFKEVRKILDLSKNKKEH